MEFLVQKTGHGRHGMGKAFIPVLISEICQIRHFWWTQTSAVQVENQLFCLGEGLEKPRIQLAHYKNMLMQYAEKWKIENLQLKFLAIFFFILSFWFAGYILYIFTAPLAEYDEKVVH